MNRRTSLLAIAGAAALAFPARPAAACVVAEEANRVVGWSADGAYALYERVTDGKLDHAEILPTTYQGFVYTITGDGEDIFVARVKVGATASFGDEGTIVERRRGKLTEKSLLSLATVRAMKFGTAGEPAAKADRPTAAFTGAKRYDAHDVEITRGAEKLVMPLPVYCVGSCLADEHWTKWSIAVDGVHALAGGATLYELSMTNVCNGGTIHRVIAPTPAGVKVPKHRSMGAGA